MSANRSDVVHTNDGSDFARAVRDVVSGMSRTSLWIALAYEDVRSRYMRSFAGISWVVLSFLFFVIVKVVIFAPMSGKALVTFAPYVTIGFFIWTFISSSISEGCTTYLSAKAWIKGSQIPSTVFVLRVVVRNVFLTSLNVIVVVGILYFTSTVVSPLIWVSGLVFLVMIINAIWICYVFGALSARYQDFIHVISTVMRVMLFLTPIFWLPEQMGRLWTDVLIYNPFAHFLIAFRDPMLYGQIPMLSMQIVSAITVGGCLFAMIVFTYSRRRIPFWL